MTKSILGINLAAVAVLVFVLSYFAGLEVLVLLAAYALLLEKNRWLVKQVFTAIYLKLAYLIAVTIIDWIFGFFAWIFKYSNFVYTIEDFFRFLLSVALILLILLAISRVMHEKDANLPIIGHLSDITMDAARRPQEEDEPTPQPQARPAPASPAATVAVPVPPAEPAPEESMAIECEDDSESAEFIDEPMVTLQPEAGQNASASDNWQCPDCGRENHGKFCMGCGKQRPE